MEVIKRWLEGSQNFTVGRLYYKQFGKDKVLFQLFDKGETPFAKQKLAEALKALLTEEKKEPQKITETVRLSTMPKGNDGITTAIELEWRPLYQRMNFLRHELDKYGTDNSEKTREACRLICEEILNLEQQCMQCWENLDHYRLHGQLPEVKNVEFVIPTDPLELATLIQTLKRNIRRNKQKAREHIDDATYPALVKKYEEHLKLINSK